MEGSRSSSPEELMRDGGLRPIRGLRASCRRRDSTCSWQLCREIWQSGNDYLSPGAILLRQETLSTLSDHHSQIDPFISRRLTCSMNVHISVSSLPKFSSFLICLYPCVRVCVYIRLRIPVWEVCMCHRAWAKL